MVLKKFDLTVQKELMDLNEYARLFGLSIQEDLTGGSTAYLDLNIYKAAITRNAGRNSAVTPEMEIRAVQLRKNGMSLRSISSTLGISKTTVARIVAPYNKGDSTVPEGQLQFHF